MSFARPFQFRVRAFPFPLVAPVGEVSGLVAFQFGDAGVNVVDRKSVV